MKGARAALRYAKAILAFSQENNSSEAVAKDMQKMNRIIQQSDALQIALENPLIETEKLTAVIDSVYPWQHVEQAHQRMLNNDNIGKLVLQVT